MYLEYKKWGERWFEALPLGNGHLGAMIYGNPCRERVDLSENTFFSGDNKTNNNQTGAKDAFYNMRKKVIEGCYQDAYDEAKKFIGIRGNYGTNIPVGSIIIDYGFCEEKVRNYKRRLNIDNGILESNFNYDDRKNSRIKMESFASHPAKLLAYRIKSNEKALNPTIRMRTYSSVSEIKYFDDSIIFYTSAREKLHSDGTSGTNLIGIIRIESDGITKSDNTGVYISEASYLILLTTMITDYDNPEFEQQCVILENDREAILYQKLDSYREQHKKDVESFMKRSELRIIGKDQAEMEAISLLYQYGRYLLLSSSREDSKLPAHLQGIWNDDVACRIGWTCDMHLDINTQMNYWPAEITNLPEVNEPLFQWVKDKLVPSGKKSAENNYGLKGWVAEIVSNSWGFTSPYWGEPLAPCPTGGVWILTHMWEHYLYTNDMTYLKDCFDIIYDAVRFFADYVFWDANLKHYSSGPAISPENSFIGEDGKTYQMDTGCTYEIIMIRELFSIFLKTAKILQFQDELTDKVNKLLPDLLQYSILENGCIGEWSRDLKQADSQHRHTSHLLGLYPFHQITPEKTPELAEAAKRTIENKLSNEQNWEDTGWARNMLILYAARLHDGDMAYYHMKKLISNLVEENYLVYHPPTRGAMSFDNVYELDGNTGVTAAIAEMLLQSHNGVIHILPALPKEWSRGCIKGLKARGNIQVDIIWNNNEMEYAQLLSEQDSICKVKYKNNERSCILKGKKKTRIVF